MMFDDIDAGMRVNVPTQPASTSITQSRDHEASNPATPQPRLGPVPEHLFYECEL